MNCGTFAWSTDEERRWVSLPRRSRKRPASPPDTNLLVHRLNVLLDEGFLFRLVDGVRDGLSASPVADVFDDAVVAQKSERDNLNPAKFIISSRKAVQRVPEG